MSGYDRNDFLVVEGGGRMYAILLILFSVRASWSFLFSFSTRTEFFTLSFHDTHSHF